MDTSADACFEIGRDVTFRPSGRGERKQLRAEGLVLKSPHGDAHLKPSIAAEGAGGFDLVILSNKSYDLDAAMDAIAPTVENSAAVLPLLNGMRHLDALDARFGPEKILGGWCAVSTTLDPDGTVRQLTPTQLLKFGERDGSRTPRVEAIEELMGGATFEAAATDHIVQEMWDKWTFLIHARPGITCLMRASVGTIMEAPGGEALTLQMIDAAGVIATAYGFTAKRGDRATSCERC